MALFFNKNQTPASQAEYEFDKVIVRAIRKPWPGDATKHIICDIDKTYIETNFETLVQLAKTALEDAQEKQTVTGASEVLRAAHGEQGQHPLHFVTASPPQLRSVLEEKLALDKIQWNSVVFKNQAYNLRKGRMNQLRQHVAYKTVAILTLTKQLGSGDIYFIGDNVELDSYIYTGIKLFLDGTLNSEQYLQFLAYTGIDDDILKELSSFLTEPPEVKVACIHIREVPGYKTIKEEALTNQIRYFESFYEVSLDYLAQGVIGVSSVWPLTRIFHNRHLTQRAELLKHLQERLSGSESSSEMHQALNECLQKLNLEGEDLPVEREKRHQQPLVKLNPSQVLDAAEKWMIQVND